jgi:hypothetical protein
MKLLVFSASVFYLLGLKLTTQIHLRPNLLNKSTTIESSSVQDTKDAEKKSTAKPFANPKDTTLSAGKKVAAPEKNISKDGKLPSSGKGTA